LEFLTNYGLFLAKALTLVVALLVVVGTIIALSARQKSSNKGQLEITRINDKYDDLRDAMRSAALDDEALKEFEKAEKKRHKEEQAQKKKKAKNKDQEQPEAERKRLFVINFVGDIKASACDSLREEITAVLTLARTSDEVLVKVESGGGMVHSYGLASSQLARITSKGVPLTVCVDKVAASGGYMMACVADKIVAAPFAILGSIGVLAQLPNFNRLLKKHDIDFEMFTAGEYKRTVTMFGENTPKGRAKFIEELEDTHILFKEFVGEHRPQVDIAAVATGEVWFGKRAKAVNLIDELQTSDEYLLAQAETSDIFEVAFTHKKTLQERLGLAAQASVDRLLMTWWERMNLSRWF